MEICYRGFRGKMCRIVDEFVKIISKKNSFQKKYLKKWCITENEKNDFEHLLNFYINQYHFTLDFLAESYLFLNTTMIEEQRYFFKNGKYRNSSFKEVNESVYQNSEYMERYMCGLSISDYMWINHITLLRYFQENLDKCSGNHYLEIGPGFGQYLIKAIKKNNFKTYLAVDISPVSVQKSKDFLKYNEFECGEKYNIVNIDFLKFSSKNKFDYIVMGEVLEHIEEPMVVLKKIYLLLSDDGKAFITTVINSPAFDHIYLFSNIKSVLNIVEDAGFVVEDYICASGNNMAIEKAERIKGPISIAMLLKKK